MVGTSLKIDGAIVRFLSNNPKLNSTTNRSIVTLNRYLTPILDHATGPMQKTNCFDKMKACLADGVRTCTAENTHESRRKRNCFSSMNSDSDLARALVCGPYLYTKDESDAPTMDDRHI